MAQAATMLATLLQGQAGPLTPHQLRALRTAAGQDQRLDPGERAIFQGLASQGGIPPELAPEIDRLLRTPPGGAIENPEVSFVRGRDPKAFDAIVQALKAHAKPGDVILWRARPEGIAHLLEDPYAHASAVLPGGKFLDAMDAEGAALVSPESLVAKGIRRLHPSDLLIARPSTPLTGSQLAELGRQAEALQGRGFSYIAQLGDERYGNCSKTVADLFQRVGVDLAPRGGRRMGPFVLPSDLTVGTRPVARIAADGTVRGVAGLDWRPQGHRVTVKLMQGASRVVAHLQGLWNRAIRLEQHHLTHVRLGR